jgi:Fe-S cluster assembly protein SufD
MHLNHYTIHYGIGMLMNFESLLYDTLNFESGASVVSLSDSELGNKETVQSILENNEKLHSVVSKHLIDFPLFNLVHTQPTDEFYFKIQKQDVLTTHVLNISVSNSARVKVTIEVEPGARVTIVESVAGTVYVGYELTIIAGEGSRIDFVSAIKESPMRTMLRNAYMGKDSHIVWHETVIEGKLIQSHTRTYLYETGARAEVKDIFALAGETVLDMYHSMYHLASHTTSDMLTKGVLEGKSRAMYQGLIHIDERAVGCTGYQKQDSLVLSDSAEVNAVPNLEIENSDVKCSHGVTTAHIDREKLFYMQSRGMDTATATELFVEGHLSPCLEVIPDEGIKNQVIQRIKENLM